MREILFRGKRLDNGEWVEGWLTYRYRYDQQSKKEILGSVIDYPHKLTIEKTIGTCICSAKVDPATVGQYTGLKDKNGKRIFEGDVVRIERAEWGFDGMSTDYRTELGAIAYDNWGMVGLIVDKYKGAPVWSDFFHVCGLTDRVHDWSFEVIGNIHDNPELLNGGADNA